MDLFWDLNSGPCEDGCHNARPPPALEGSKIICDLHFEYKYFICIYEEGTVIPVFLNRKKCSSEMPRNISDITQ
jgi:hypothetical protein